METKELAIAFCDRIWNQKDLTALDELAHPDIFFRSPFGTFEGRDAFEQFLKSWFHAFPDLIVTKLEVVTEGNIVAIHWDTHGSHLGEFKGVKPTGKPIAYIGLSLYKIKDNKIHEIWAYSNK